MAATLSLALGCGITEDRVRERAATTEAYKARLEALLREPGITQRTPEWYAARGTMITASDIAQALGCAKFGTQKQFFQKKCASGGGEAPLSATLAPLRWGVMYEPVAAAVYQARTGCKLHEFGLLRHPSLDFLGASPDGINELGVMVEIKCPWRRKITGEIPHQYYLQIQGQLDVCGLEECDYAEFGFTECPLPHDEQDDQGDLIARGAFVERPPPPGADPATTLPDCVYAPVGLRSEALSAWAAQRLAEVAGSRVHWWRLETESTVRVLRDPAFAAEVVPQLREAWGRVLRYRGDREAFLAEVGDPAPPKTPLKEVDAAVPQQAGGFAFVDDRHDGFTPQPSQRLQEEDDPQQPPV